MACSYTQIPSTFGAASAGYTYPVNVENMLRNKADLYSTYNTERLGAQIPTPFANTLTGFNAINNQVVPVQEAIRLAKVFGADTGAKLAWTIAARFGSFVGHELAVRIGAEMGAEFCAKLAVELATRPVSNTFEAEQCLRRCVVFGAECGAKIGATVAQRCGLFAQAEIAARIGSEIFAEACNELCCKINKTFNNNTFGYPTFDSRFGGLFNNNWTGLNTFNNWTGYPTLSGFNNWNNQFSNKWTGLNNQIHHDKLYNIAFRPSSEVELYCLTNPIRINDLEGNRQLYLCFELKSYKPEEVTVTLNKAERAVVVEAAHEVKEGKEHQVSRKYSRKFVLPESLAKVDLAKVELKSHMTAEGYLVVECQLPKMTTEEIAKCPTMSKVYNAIPFQGYNTAFGGFNNINSDINNVRPVTVKTA